MVSFLFTQVVGDHLAYRYEILKYLGRGSFGEVVQALDHAVPEQHQYSQVAIKIMHNDTRA